MNALAIKAALRYVAGWGTIVLFACLLTLIFSFLGAFFCAALAGMMLGSCKIRPSATVATSVIFPAVLLVILRSGGSELLSGQLGLLSVLCFGTFWMTYAVVRAVVWYEHKGQPTSSKPSVNADSVPAPSHPAGPAIQTRVGGISRSALTLGALQGKWSSMAIGANSHAERKLLEISNEKLLLSITDGNGQMRVLGRGELKLTNKEVVSLLSVATGTPEPDDSLICI